MSAPTPGRGRHPRESYAAISDGIAANRGIRIISYMTKQALPAVSVLTSETFEEFKTAD